MVKSTIAVAVIAGLLFLVCGCAHEQFPRVKPGTIEGFSSGSAKVPVFKSRPTAKELHSALVKFYDSFDSWAASGICNSETPKDKEKPESNRFELRDKKPDKVLNITKGRHGSVLVTNGKHGIWYWPDSNEYYDNYEVSDKAGAGRETVAADLPSDTNTRVRGMRLLPDKVINGVEVYVLEIKLAGVEHRLTETDTFYIAKNDLLPRKTTSVRDLKDNGEAAKKNYTNYTRVFSGFRANLKLPDAMFSTTPPRGAKHGS